jgi:hypothetical protein
MWRFREIEKYSNRDRVVGFFSFSFVVFVGCFQ